MLDYALASENEIQNHYQTLGLHYWRWAKANGIFTEIDADTHHSISALPWAVRQTQSIFASTNLMLTQLYKSVYIR